MRRITNHLSYANVVSTACFFLLLGGTAWAVSGSHPSSGRVIHACYAKKGGAMRLVASTKCHKGERAISWNSTGVPGVPGTPGQPGGVGPAGPSDIYADGASTGSPTGSYAAYGTLSLPAGSYFLTGNAVAIDTGAGGSEISCSLAASTTHVPDWDDANATLVAPGSREIIDLTSVQTFPTNQQVQIICRLRAGTATLDDVRVVAIKTGALHGSTPVD